MLAPLVDPVTVSIIIAKPPAEVFEYLADIANHAEFSDHYLKEWHLTRVDSYGEGAGARYKAGAPFQRFGWADTNFVTLVAPHRIVGVGRGGKFNRIKTFAEWRLAPAPAGGTRVEFTAETEPATPIDRFIESLGTRGWFKRNGAKALRRLRDILEDGEGAGARATVGGL